MIIPDEHFHRAIGSRRKSVDIGLSADARIADRLNVGGARARDGHPVAVHLPEHAEHVQHGFVDAVRRQIAEPREGRLSFELEGPRDGSEQVVLVQVCQLERPCDLGSRVARIHRPIPIGVLGIGANRTGGASFGVRLADYDR